MFPRTIDMGTPSIRSLGTHRAGHFVSKLDKGKKLRRGFVFYAVGSRILVWPADHLYLSEEDLDPEGWRICSWEPSLGHSHTSRLKTGNLSRVCRSTASDNTNPLNFFFIFFFLKTPLIQAFKSGKNGYQIIFINYTIKLISLNNTLRKFQLIPILLMGIFYVSMRKSTKGWVTSDPNPFSLNSSWNF